MQNLHRKISESTEDQLAQALLSKFLSGEISTLEPTFDAKTGYHFTAVEALVGGHAEKAENMLFRLAQEKVLEQKLYDKVIYCPSCGSNTISFRYSCPTCKSFNIKKSSLIEHVKCGYMDMEENFRKNGSLVCPKCHAPLKNLDVDYRKAGVWCACKECGKSFDVPLAQHYCTRCHAVSTFEDAVIKDVFSYTLSQASKEKLSSNAFFVAPLREVLAKLGLRVESPSFLQGKSGARHSFNIGAYNPKTNEIVVLDLASSTEGPVSEQPVIALFAKVFDVSPSKAVLVAVPKLTEQARRMAELYKINAIESVNQDDAAAALKKALGSF